MWLVIVSGVVGLVVVYIMYTLMSSSGSEYNDTSIDAFIIETDGSLTKPMLPKIDPYKRKYDKPGKQILILYGTEYGFSEEIAKKLFDRIDASVEKHEQFPWQPRVVDVKHYEHTDISQEQILLIIISTAGDGIAPTEARPFCNWLDDRTDRFPHVSYSVLALGDSNYPHFCRTGRNVHQRLSDLGCCCVVPRHDVDMEDWEVINKWYDQVEASLHTLMIEPALDYLDIPDTAEEGAGPSRTRPFMATLTVKYSLTQQTHVDDKETIHCEFDLTDSNISWTSGDALGVYPKNNPTEVDRLLKVMGCSGSETIDVPKWVYEPKPEGSLAIKICLMKYFDLKTVRPELIQLLHREADGTVSKQELDSLLKDGISKKNNFLHEYLYEREVADVLSDFTDAASQLTSTAILGQMKGLQPRYYSIASSPVLTKTSCSVTAAVVRYMSLGLARTGVTTTYLQDRLSVSQLCPVFISQNPEFRLPADGDVPVIMVGPGTGIAPFMAFISERIHTRCTGKNILYFGCRNKEKDFLYRKELESWATEDKITLQTAFSRDQPNKIYVQDLIKQDAEMICDMIRRQRAHFYVCGDAKHMAHDVHTQLVALLCHQGARDTREAEGFLRDLERCGRYQKDVWVT